MNNAELYQKSNTLQKRDAQQCLEEYAKKIKWKNYGDTVIDIGCGDGSVTSSILKTFLPGYCKMLVGCDVSEKMIHFANIHHAENFVRFMVFDIESDLPEQLREKFEHAFSFYSLHWIKHQEIAFRNIYDLLTREGQCLLMFLGHMPLYDVFRRLSRSPRWNYWMRNIEGFVSPYHDCQDPEKNIKAMTTAIGFTNVDVKCLQKEFVYRGAEVLKSKCIDAMSAINPFEIPMDMQEDFWEDFIKIIRDKEIVESSIEVDDTFNIKIYIIQNISFIFD